MDYIFLTRNREVTAKWHFEQVLNWLEFDNNRHLDSVLVYASFELRCAIERLLLENILIIKGGELSPEEEKRCKTKME